MTETMWVRSHVERLLQDQWDLCRATADDDGDYPFRHGTAAGWVSIVETGDVPFVRVWAHAALGIKPTSAMWRELNDIQLRCLSSSVMWASGTVIVSQTLSPVGLAQSVLAQALSAVGNVADDVGLLLAGMFGGETPFPADEPRTEDETAT